MKYKKPELVVLPSAVEAIQRGIRKSDTFMDNVDLEHPLNATAAAYEADE